jgi:hypothetical protein
LLLTTTSFRGLYSFNDSLIGIHNNNIRFQGQKGCKLGHISDLPFFPTMNTMFLPNGYGKMDDDSSVSTSFGSLYSGRSRGFKRSTDGLVKGEGS